MTNFKHKINSFDFEPGRKLGGKYEVMSKLGEGWEGEVYLVKENATGIERAAKFFFPHRNPQDKALNFYAKKLHKLRNCRTLIHYITHEKFRFKNTPLTFLVSDYIEGEILLDLLKRQPGKRLDYFQGLHLLYSLALAVEEIHKLRDYHGDLHSGNVMVRHLGLGFDVKLLDFYPLGTSKKEGIKDDICDVIKIFYDSIGGRKWYAKHPPVVKSICCGLKRGLILKKFRTISTLRKHLETMTWDDA